MKRRFRVTAVVESPMGPYEGQSIVCGDKKRHTNHPCCFGGFIESVEQLPEPMTAEDALAEIAEIASDDRSLHNKLLLDIRGILARYQEGRDR